MGTIAKIIIIMIVIHIYLFSGTCYESSVKSPTPLMGNNGEIINLLDGSLWEVKYEYLYLYEYNPSVIICPDKNLLIVNSHKINVMPIKNNSKNPTHNDSSIDSFIENEFSGLKHGNIYKLANGQIWEQTEPWYWYWYWAYPKVFIYKDGNIYKMKVENIEHPVVVRRIK